MRFDSFVLVAGLAKTSNILVTRCNCCNKKQIPTSHIHSNSTNNNKTLIRFKIELHFIATNTRESAKKDTKWNEITWILLNGAAATTTE